MKKAAATSLALMPFVLFAQTAAAPATVAKEAGQTDVVWYIILGTMLMLLFAIMVLGSVLVNLVKVVIEKGKSKPVALVLLLLASGSLFAQNAAAPASAPATGSMLGENWNMIMAGCVLLAELFVVIVLLLRIRLILIELSDKKEEKVPVELHLPRLFDNINASVAVEKEADILLDHNYDGIRELDNNLPPWWKYSFYLSMIFAVCYLSYYHVLGGPSSKDEYDASMKKAEIEHEEYNRLNAGKVDENAVKMADAAGIEDGKGIFTTNCAPCHGHLGEGVVGPNLTDDYWLHGGSLNDIYKTIKTGYPAKGMKSWATDLSPVQIRNVASFIKTLHGTNPPNAKAPQGEMEGGAPAAVDSTKSVQNAVDTAAKKSI